MVANELVQQLTELGPRSGTVSELDVLHLDVDVRALGADLRPRFRAPRPATAQQRIWRHVGTGDAGDAPSQTFPCARAYGDSREDASPASPLDQDQAVALLERELGATDVGELRDHDAPPLDDDSEDAP